jgi:hypothetical protein
LENLKKLVGEEVFNTYIAPKLAQGKKYFFGEGEFIPKGRFDEINNQAKDYKSQIEARDKQIEELKKSVSGNEELTKRLNELTEANKRQKEEYEKQLAQKEFDYAYNLALSKAGAKDQKVLDALIDKTKLVFKDGNLSGLNEQLEALKKTHDWVFETPANPTPNRAGFPPNPNPQLSPAPGAGQELQNRKPWNRLRRTF